MMKIRRTTRLICLSTRLVVLFALWGSAFAQQVTAPASSPLSSTTDTTSTDSDSNSSSSSSSSISSGSQLGQRSSLTAAQITLILQQKPELVVELKSLVADQLQQQGVPAQADSITDEMLLSQISTNAALRSQHNGMAARPRLCFSRRDGSFTFEFRRRRGGTIAVVGAVIGGAS